jgi:hypothetical protein
MCITKLLCAAGDDPVRLELPNQWLWDIIDEFIYQFQSFSQFRSKLAKMPDMDVEMLKTNPKVRVPMTWLHGCKTA